MSDLMKKMQAAFDKVNKEAVAGVYGSRYVPNDDPDRNPDVQPDFPYIEDPEGYTTHVPIEQDEIQEAEGDEALPKPGDAGEEAGTNAASSQTPEPSKDTAGIGGTGMDTAGNMPGVGAAMPGMPGIGEQEEEEQLTSTQIGRVYELKKIYSRLSAVESYLTRTTDEEILEVRKLVAQSIDLFELVISNYDQYKDNVDDIIVTYYEFLSSVYETMRKYFAEMSKE